MKYCSNCGQKLTGEEKFCKHCGKRVGVETDSLIEKAKKYSDTEYSPAIPIYKLILLSIATLGIYEAVWFYKNWNRLKAVGKVKGNTILRTTFGALNMYFLMDGAFQLVKEETDTKSFPSAGWLAFAYFILIALWRLPDGWWWLASFSFLPLIPVQNALNYYWKQKEPDKEPRRGFSLGEVVVLILGGGFTLLALIGTFSNSSTSADNTNTPTPTEYIYATPTPDYETQYDDEFLKSCNSKGTHYTYCSCVLQYLKDNYTLSQRLQMDEDYSKTNQVPQAVTDAANSCSR